MSPTFFSINYQKQVLLELFRGPEINGKRNQKVAIANWIVSILIGGLVGMLLMKDHDGMALLVLSAGSVAIGLFKSVTVTALTRPTKED